MLILTWPKIQVKGSKKTKKKKKKHQQPTVTASSINPPLPVTIHSDPNNPQKQKNSSKLRTYRTVSFHVTKNLTFPLLQMLLGAVLLKSPIWWRTCLYSVLRHFWETRHTGPPWTNCPVLNTADFCTKSKANSLAVKFQQQLFRSNHGCEKQNKEISWVELL